MMRGGRIQLAFGKIAESAGKLLATVAEHELKVEFLVDSEHRLELIALHTHPDDDDASVSVERERRPGRQLRSRRRQF